MSPETREQHIARKMPEWERKRRECDERDRRQGVACQPGVYECPDYEEIMRIQRYNDNWDRAELLLLINDESGEGEALLILGDGTVERAHARGFLR